MYMVSYSHCFPPKTPHKTYSFLFKPLFISSILIYFGFHEENPHINNLEPPPSSSLHTSPFHPQKCSITISMLPFSNLTNNHNHKNLQIGKAPFKYLKNLFERSDLYLPPIDIQVLSTICYQQYDNLFIVDTFTLFFINPLKLCCQRSHHYWDIVNCQ